MTSRPQAAVVPKNRGPRGNKGQWKTATCTIFSISFILSRPRILPLPSALLGPLSFAVQIKFPSAFHHSGQQKVKKLCIEVCRFFYPTRSRSSSTHPRSCLLYCFFTSFPHSPRIISLRAFMQSCKWAGSTLLLHHSSPQIFAHVQVQLLLPVLHRLAPL